MAIRAVTYLKNLFATGKKPSQADYHDWMDSYVHKTEVEAINVSVINERINNYDNSLKEVTAGPVSTLGGVLAILTGFDTTANVKALLEAAGGQVTWETVTGKPTQVNVVWEEQTISLDAYLPGTPASPEVIQSVSVVRNIGKLSSEKKAVIIDLLITNVQVQWLGVSWSSFPVHRIRAVVIAINPKINLP